MGTSNDLAINIPDHNHSTLQMLEELRWLQVRLANLRDGDCAYERALCNTYRKMIDERLGLLSDGSVALM